MRFASSSKLLGAVASTSLFEKIEDGSDWRLPAFLSPFHRCSRRRLCARTDAKVCYLLITQRAAITLFLETTASMQAKIETIPIARHARVAPITEEPDEHSTTHDAAVPAMANVVAAAARKEPPTPRLDRQKTLGRLTKSLFGGGEGRARWSIMRAANKSSRSAALEAEDAARRAAAALIQKRFRDQTFLHRDVGPTVMCLKGGARALWGSINFGRARQSSFLACSDTTSAPLIAHIFQLHWSLSDAGDDPKRDGRRSGF